METPLQRLDNRFPHTGFSGSADKEMQEDLGPAYGIALGRSPPALCFIRMNVLSGAMERDRWVVTISLACAYCIVTQAGTPSQDPTARCSRTEDSAFWPESNQSSWAITQMGGHPRTPSEVIPFLQGRSAGRVGDVRGLRTQ